MKVATYHGMDGKEIKIEYDENKPCLICDEPVLAASMGGTNICGSCDCGKCRYCGVTIFILKPEIDGGRSKGNLLKHMEWHKKYTPELVERVNSFLRKLGKKGRHLNDYQKR